jgi:hypothetical protein
MSNGYVKLNINETLSFFDERPSENGQHTSAITSVIGEELGWCLLHRCLEETYHCSATVLTCKGWRIKPIKSGPNGKRKELDCWILTEHNDGSKILYQVEIKNWNANSVGVGRGCWSDIFDSAACKFRTKSEKYRDALEKATVRMTLPLDRVDDHFGRLSILHGFCDENHQSILCLWANDPSGEPLRFETFKVPINDFGGLWIFSMSSYLRKVRDAGTIPLWMPMTTTRIETLKRITSEMQPDAALR